MLKDKEAMKLDSLMNDFILLKSALDYLITITITIFFYNILFI